MPKISNNTITIFNEHIKKEYGVEIMYNQEWLFYTVVHSSFHELCHHMTEEDKKLFSLNKKPERGIPRYSLGKLDSYRTIITASTESECLILTKRLYERLINQTLKQRKVIILFYIPNGNTTYNDHKMNPEHPTFGFTIGMTYAIETSTGDKKVYSIYKEYESFGETKIQRKEIQLWNDGAKIIDDTPENRQYLDSLYSRLKTLRDAITEFTSTPEKLLELIQSQQKLLS